MLMLYFAQDFGDKLKKKKKSSSLGSAAKVLAIDDIPHSVAPSLPPLTAYHMKYNVPDCGIQNTSLVRKEYKS